jgi:hypothetical protein
MKKYDAIKIHGKEFFLKVFKFNRQMIKKGRKDLRVKVSIDYPPYPIQNWESKKLLELSNAHYDYLFGEYIDISGIEVNTKFFQLKQNLEIYIKGAESGIN